MREPEELAGAWAIETPTATCAITFTTRRVESANGWAIDDPGGCLAAVVSGAVAWRPTPEGVALAADDRRTLVVFNAAADGQTATASLNGGTATLRRT